MTGIRFPARAKHTPLLHRVKTDSGAYPASYPMGTGGREVYPRRWSGRGVKLITHHLVPRLRMMELYLHSPISLRGIMINYIIEYRNNFSLLWTKWWNIWGRYVCETLSLIWGKETYLVNSTKGFTACVEEYEIILGQNFGLKVQWLEATHGTKIYQGKYR
jgi:hypothetical protein